MYTLQGHFLSKSSLKTLTVADLLGHHVKAVSLAVVSEKCVDGWNFVRIHSTLRVTPAMEAGLTDHVWTLQEMPS